MPFVGGALIDGKLSGFSNLDPNLPNPGAGGIPGAFVFSTSGPGRTGSDTMFDGYKKAFGPRLGVAYAARLGTVVPMSAGRSFEAVKTTAGSTHFEGLILNRDYSSTDSQVLNFPTLLDQGLPPWQKPFIDPTVGWGNPDSTFTSTTFGVIRWPSERPAEASGLRKSSRTHAH